MPEHRKYVEPYGGAASVLLLKPRAYAEVYNDLDGDIVNFFRVLRDPFMLKRLVKVCELTPYAREEFEGAFEDSDEPIERARRTAVRASMGFGSAGATKNTTGFRIDTDREYSTAMHNWVDYPSGLAAVGKRFTGVLIENRPAVNVMQQHDASDTLHFVDPPYMPETRNSGRCYQHEMTVEDHFNLIRVILGLKGMVMLCGYETSTYNQYLVGWKKVSTKARISAARGTKCKTDCMWLNPALVEKLTKPQQMEMWPGQSKVDCEKGVVKCQAD